MSIQSDPRQRTTFRSIATFHRTAVADIGDIHFGCPDSIIIHPFILIPTSKSNDHFHVQRCNTFHKKFCENVIAFYRERARRLDKLDVKGTRASSLYLPIELFGKEKGVVTRSVDPPHTQPELCSIAISLNRTLVD